MNTIGPIITLITNFGFKDSYVEVMKGAIYSSNPWVRIVELSHNVSCFNLKAAVYLLKTLWSYFPNRTIHVVK